jgi:2-polyprenyl-3-methyl-5-hydroxy-6-metoxy-1,4-benzoquinol methylase
MDPKAHWDDVYRRKPPTAVSWYAAHLATSLRLIEQVAPHPAAQIIDVGGGESTLVDDLVSAGYRNVSVLDISATAVEVAKQRLGANADRVTWIVDDVTRAVLPEHRFDVWHDRAVFHFLTEPDARQAYVRQVAMSMKQGGHVIVATFGPEGPKQCSGRDVVRYDAHSLHDEFGARFDLVQSTTELHETPWGAMQQFVYCLCKVE